MQQFLCIIATLELSTSFTSFYLLYYLFLFPLLLYYLSHVLFLYYLYNISFLLYYLYHVSFLLYYLYHVSFFSILPLFLFTFLLYYLSFTSLFWHIIFLFSFLLYYLPLLNTADNIQQNHLVYSNKIGTIIHSCKDVTIFIETLPDSYNWIIVWLIILLLYPVC